MTCEAERFTAANIPPLRGYVVIVTGGNAGIGYETALQLARHDARVYIASRSEARVMEAIAKMRRVQASVDVHFLKLDLQDLNSVKAAAAEFERRETRLDILINNAGIMACPYEHTKDGHEVQWQTCFLAHHAFTLSLLPMMRQTAQQRGSARAGVRIVNVSSDAALFMGPDTIQYDDTNLSGVTGSLAPWRRYSHCKKASIIAAKAINTRYDKYGIAAYSLHPGVIKTGLQAHDTSFLGTITRVTMKLTPTSTVEEGARNSLFVATSPLVTDHGGKFYGPVGKLNHRAEKLTSDPKTADMLWDLADRQLRDHGFAFDH
ncbi:hypothetical protein LTR05_004430 [Lithohypha guttulata]|uniref:Uncharacterized protein n=1 Tax=Lithohypha guttulata TaxID=1690604 RepID=A0AAN7Y6C7_9EURO|nr:hypothetical protein LTR05_004430 [Lithohypha guttulata]